MNEHAFCFLFPGSQKTSSDLGFLTSSLLPSFEQLIKIPRIQSHCGNRSPLKFFLLVFALSLPFWLAGTLTGLQLLPGLPVAALHLRLPSDSGLDSCLRREQDRGLDRASEAILRLQANQSEGVVRNYPSPDARSDGLVL